MSRNGQLMTCSGAQMSTCCDLGDRDTTVGQVHWHFAEQTPVSQHAQLVTDWQLVQQHSTLVVACRWLYWEPRRGLHCSSRCATWRRHARVSLIIWQSVERRGTSDSECPMTVSAETMPWNCTVINGSQPILLPYSSKNFSSLVVSWECTALERHFYRFHRMSDLVCLCRCFWQYTERSSKSRHNVLQWRS